MSSLKEKEDVQEDRTAVLWKLLNKVTKWRTIFASWQLGTRGAYDAECNALKDHREVTMLLRMEMNAMLGLLKKNGIITEEDWTGAMIEEAKLTDADLEKRFPGAKSSEGGMVLNTSEFMETCKKYNFPP